MSNLDLIEKLIMEQVHSVARQRRRTQKEIAVLLAEYGISKLSIGEFCATKQIPRHTFHKWISRNKKKQSKIVPAPAFAPIRVVQNQAAVLFAEVDGVKIYQPVSALFLKQLMK